MNIPALATRIYSPRNGSTIGGFRDADFAPRLRYDTVKPHTAIVRPIKPPEMLGGIIISAAVQALPGTACMIYEVIAAGDFDEERSGKDLCVSPGEVVTLRTAHLEPLQPDLMLHAISFTHVLSILPDDADKLDDQQTEAHIRLDSDTGFDALPTPPPALTFPPLRVVKPDDGASGASMAA